MGEKESLATIRAFSFPGDRVVAFSVVKSCCALCHMFCIGDGDIVARQTSVAGTESFVE